MEKTAGWKTTTGKDVTVTAKLITAKTINLDRHKVDVNCCEKSIDVYVDGFGSQGDYIQKITPRVFNGLSVSHVVGKLVLTQEQVEIIRALEKEITDTPEWIDKVEKEEALQEANMAYDIHYAKIKKAMEC